MTRRSRATVHPILVEAVGETLPVRRERRSGRWTRRAWGIALAIALFLPTLAAAQNAVPTLTALPHTDAERTEFINARLEAERTAARTWWVGWLAGYSTLAVGQGTAALHLRGKGFDALRPPLIVGALGSVIGAIGMLLMPWPETWATGPSPSLHSSERRLQFIANAEVLGHSWKAHLAATLVTVTGSLVLWLACRLPVNALVNLVVGMAVGEAQIFTQPTTGLRDAVDYRDWNAASPGAWTLTF